MHRPIERADATAAPPIRFVFPKLGPSNAELSSTSPPDPDARPEMMIDGVDAWVLQTHLRLARRGYATKLVSDYEPGAIHVCHFDTIRALGAPPDAFVVGVRGDRSPLKSCDVEVVQSPCHVGPRRAHLMDHWPQPGLVPRDPSRGARVERIGFFGFGVNLHPRYRSDEFKAELSKLGVVLVERLAGGWTDYRDLDLVLAVRALPRVFQDTKPATKLVNAWLAGCPALLGREAAYRHVGRPGTDYVEVASPDEVLDGIRRFQADAASYRAFQERGRERARAHDVDAVTRQWIALLDGPVRDEHARWSRTSALARRARRRVQAGRQWLAHKTFWTVAHGERVLRRHETLGG